MNIEQEIRLWQETTAIDVFRRSGFDMGDTIVDFGCGIGNYTIPLAALVGKQGLVYAVDIDRYVLRDLEQKMQQLSISGIQIMPIQRDVKLRLADETADGFLVYDLIHYLEMGTILRESHRVLKTDGIFSVLPFHMSRKEIERMLYDIQHFGFVLDNIQEGEGIHFEMHRYYGRSSAHLKDVERGNIYNFKKIK